jgi:hypothetical protein
MTGLLMNDELEMMWQEAAVACFWILFQHSPGTEENRV